MNRIDVIPWDNNFNTGLAEIDAQHRKLVEIINQLAASFAFDASTINLSTVFDELIAYTHYHFSAEETIWNSYLLNEKVQFNINIHMNLSSKHYQILKNNRERD